jgi:hypothetical protein
MQTIFEKFPFRGNDRSRKLFYLIPRGLNLPAGSDNPQINFLQGIIPRRTRSYGVSEPTEISLAGYQTSQNNGRVMYTLW